MTDRTKLLAAPQQALWNYLDTLLQEIPANLPFDEAQEEIQDWDPTALEPAEPVQTEPVHVLPGVAETPKDAHPQEIPATTEVPAWAQNDFQALLFTVGKLTLAVPLITLHSVFNWPEAGVTPMPNQPDWCLGLIHYRERNVRIIDTAQLVIPSDRPHLQPDEAAQHILIVGDGRLGLACNAIGNVVTLSREGVRWRKHAGNRPWLAGTVLDHLCALMDTEALSSMLQA